MADLVIPIVHMNGTSREALKDERANVIDALVEAGKHLARMAPNGRDYYLEKGLMDKAVAQQERRMNTLKSLITELEAELEAIDSAS